MHRFRINLLFSLFFAFCASSAVSGLTLTVQTAAGDSVFFAGLADTVTVDLVVDSGGEAITGVELFLSYNPTLFLPIDTDLSEFGNQPVMSAGNFGQVFADSVIQSSGTSSVIHYAEVDLIGQSVSGVLATVQFRVVGLLSGQSPIGVHADSTGSFLSLYTTADREGASVPIPATARAVFEDLPPTFTTASSFSIEEDSGPAFLLTGIANDRESKTGVLTFAVEMEDTSVSAIVEGDSLRFVTPADLSGAFTGQMTVTDPAGGASSQPITLFVLPVNDPPRIDRTTLADTVLIGSEAVVLSLAGGDVDDSLATLKWITVVLSDSLSAAIEGSSLTLTAPENWNGSAQVTVQLVDPGGLVDFHSIRVLGTAVQGDFDRDGAVGFSDFLMFAEAFGGTSTQFDLDGSGVVDFSDFLIFAENFG